MPTDQPSGVLQQLRRAALLRDGGRMTDGQLLEGFITRREEAAFEVLVRRHGPMVLGVCRRVLRNPHDAEDAFQATFLVLVRKAAAITQRELLGNWLYGVAYRTALDARAAAARRRTRERQVSTMPEPEAVETAHVWPDLRPLLDQELNRLPDRYRVPVVLCDLEGRTRRDVARQLGLPEGTLSGRLTTARRLLAQRLTRRGLALSSGVLAAALSPSAASAYVPSPLVAATVRAATAIAAGQAVAAVVSAEIAALAEGGIKPMFGTKLKIAAVLLAAGTIAGAALLAHQPTTDQPPAAPTGKTPDRPQVDREAGYGGTSRVLKLDARGRRFVWSPDGKTLAVVTKVEKTVLGYKYDGKGSAIKLWDVDKGQARQTLAEDTGPGLAFQQVDFSSDGKTIAATVSEQVLRPGSITIRQVVKLWDAKTLALKRTLGDDCQLVCVALSPDGKRVAAGDVVKKTVTLWNSATGAVERTLNTGDAQPWSVAFSPAGNALVVGGQRNDHSGVITLWNARTGKLTHTLEQERFVNHVVFSPNGRMIASGGGDGEVTLWDVADGTRIASLRGHERGTRSVAFSPDGKTVAAGAPDGKVRLWDVATGKLKETLTGHESEVHCVAFSPDGQTLASVGQDQTLRLWKSKRGVGKKLD